MSVELKSFKPENPDHINKSYIADSQDDLRERGDRMQGKAYMTNGITPTVVTVDNDDDDGVHFEKLEVSGGKFTTFVAKLQGDLDTFWDKYGSVVIYTILIILGLAYLAYFAYAMHYEFGSEKSVRLLWYTLVAVLGIALYFINKIYHRHSKSSDEIGLSCDFKHGEHVSWALLILVYVGVITFIIIDMAHLTKDYYNLVSLGGLLLYVIVFYITSYSPAHVNWRAVLWGLGMQLLFAIIILRWTVGYQVFQWIGDRVTNFLSHSDAGAAFLFGDGFREHFFAFSVLPVIIYFSTIISVLYYLGVMQFVVQKLGWCLQALMGTTAGESLNAAGNIFIGQSEAPLMIRPLIGIMTRSELHAVMTGGFATIAGSVLAAYIEIGVPANHLISASVMSAPAALAISKLRFPETEVSKTTAEDVKSMEPSKERNIIEAASNGACQSVKLVANIAVNLIAFIAILAFVNDTLRWFGARAGVEEVTNEPFTFEFLCSYLLYPLALFMGVHTSDCRKVAGLIGVKTFLNEFVAYAQLSVLLENGETVDKYEEAYGSNGTWSHKDGGVLLEEVTGQYNETFLPEGILNKERSEVIATYALCGFSNIGSMGIMMGALGAMAPNRKKDLSSIVLSAMIAGNVACFMTACIAGLFYQENI